MKRTLLTVAAIILCINAFADDKSQTLLGALQNQVASWGNYRVDFTVTVGGQTTKGSFEVSGESYRVTTPEIELFCDGTTKYEVNYLDREVAVDRVDPNDRTVMGNPTKLFDFLDGSYSRRYVGPALIGGVGCERIELKDSVLPSDTSSKTSSGTPGMTIDVFLSTETGRPVRVGYTIGFMSTEVAVDVVKITPQITLGADFRYDPARYSGYEVIDFR